jgi:hypothetical protein
VLQSLNGKNRKTGNIISDNSTFEPITDFTVQPKTSCVLGADLIAKKNNTEISLGYNVQFHKKYQAQQVFLNIKLKM